MPIATNKKELLTDIRATYNKLQSLLNAVDEKLSRQKLLPGQIKNTTMSPHNLVSYLLGWAEEVLSWNQAYCDTGTVPEIPVSGYGELAVQFYSAYSEYGYSELLVKLNQTVAAIVTMLESKTEAELYEEVWYTTVSSGRDYTFGRLVQLNTAAAYRNAYNRLRSLGKHEVG